MSTPDLLIFKEKLLNFWSFIKSGCFKEESQIPIQPQIDTLIVHRIENDSQLMYLYLKSQLLKFSENILFSQCLETIFGNLDVHAEKFYSYWEEGTKPLSLSNEEYLFHSLYTVLTYVIFIMEWTGFNEDKERLTPEDEFIEIFKDKQSFIKFFSYIDFLVCTLII